MKEKFIRLQQQDRNLDVCAVKFLRFIWFAPYMVANKENRANRF